jgi:hypothetical protein
MPDLIKLPPTISITPPPFAIRGVETKRSGSTEAGPGTAWEQGGRADDQPHTGGDAKSHVDGPGAVASANTKVCQRPFPTGQRSPAFSTSRGPGGQPLSCPGDKGLPTLYLIEEAIDGALEVFSIAPGRPQPALGSPKIAK